MVQLGLTGHSDPVQDIIGCPTLSLRGHPGETHLLDKGPANIPERGTLTWLARGSGSEPGSSLCFHPCGKGMRLARLTQLCLIRPAQAEAVCARAPAAEQCLVSHRRKQGWPFLPSRAGVGGRSWEGKVSGCCWRHVPFPAPWTTLLLCVRQEEGMSFKSQPISLEEHWRKTRIKLKFTLN
jgi:hypothetical protein